MLLPLQILFLNLVTDVFPALALGMGKGDRLIMEQEIRKKDDPIISNKDWLAILGYAIILSVAVLGLHYYLMDYLGYDESYARSMVFYGLAVIQLFHVFNLIPGKSRFTDNEIVRNPYIWGAIALSLLLILGVGLLPQTAEALSLEPVVPTHLMLIALAALSPVIIIRIIKFMAR